MRPLNPSSCLSLQLLIQYAYSVNANLVAVRKALSTTIAVLFCWGFMSDHVLEENKNFLQALSEAYNKPQKSSCPLRSLNP
ncbi:unnamed protein product, partial [Vitis vinifera]|uniref:Uncharacterized protein n=1 Tax=Vitis vinifera TaxID=29760 RepID=D7TDN3_VITVI